MKYLQIRMNHHLNNFLNGYSLNKKSMLLYPFYDYNKFYIDDLFIEHLIENSQIMNEFYENLKIKTSGFKNLKLILSGKEFVYLLHCFYSGIAQINTSKSTVGLNSFHGKKEVIIKTRDYDIWFDNKLKKGNDFSVLSKIIDNITKNEIYIFDLLIQGSFATLDYTSWSDLDLNLILKKGIIYDISSIFDLRKRLIRINKLFFLNDPLQHHGFFIIPMEFFDDYHEEYLPLVVFKQSVSLFNKNYILNVNSFSNEYYIQWLLNGINSIEINLQQNKKYSNYELKLLFHQLLLIPSFFLESKGIFLYKKNTFEEIRNWFEPDVLQILETLTDIRNEFNYNPKYQQIFQFAPNFNYYRIYNSIHYSLLRKYNINNYRSDIYRFIKGVKNELKDDL